MPTANEHDITILRDLAKRYADVAAKPIQNQRRKLWSDHFSLKPTRPLILTSIGIWNVWCRDVFGDARMQCQDPFYREYERNLRMALFVDSVGDDTIAEPWIGVRAAVEGNWGEVWGLKTTYIEKPGEGGSWKFDPPIKQWRDMDKLRVTPHRIDETETKRCVSRLADAIGDILAIDVSRSPCYLHFMADISTCLGQLRGLEQVMVDMYESPAELHRLLAFMRDGILANNQQAEEAGDFTLTSGHNQAMPYCDDLEWPKPNSGPRQRKQVWGFGAQEFTLISPAFHEQFMFRYQLPILEHFGPTHYGCCEDLGTKIDMLRKLKNLRSIAITPVADVAKCARQIGTDYAISWRPNPTDMVCAGWSEDRVRRIILKGLEACRGQYVHLHLKDIETLEGDTERLSRWVGVVRNVIEEMRWD